MPRAMRSWQAGQLFLSKGAARALMKGLDDPNVVFLCEMSFFCAVTLVVSFYPVSGLGSPHAESAVSWGHQDIYFSILILRRTMDLLQEPAKRIENRNAWKPEEGAPKRSRRGFCTLTTRCASTTHAVRQSTCMSPSEACSPAITCRRPIHNYAYSQEHRGLGRLQGRGHVAC